MPWLAAEVGEVGEVDILINNTGMGLFAPTAEFKIARFDKMFVSNVPAPFFLIAGIAPGMVVSLWGDDAKVANNPSTNTS